MKEIKIYKSPRVLIIALACTTIILVLMVLFNKPQVNLPIWVWILFVAMEILFLSGVIYSFFDKKPYILINEIGIFAESVHNELINWEVIEDAYPIKISNQRFICLKLKEEFKPSSKKGKLSQLSAKVDEAIGAQELNIFTNIINVNETLLAEFILLMRTAKQPEKSKLITEALTQWNLKKI